MKTDIIRLIKKLFEPATLTRKGKIYFGGLEKSFSEYGLDGLQTQVGNIVANSKWPKKFKTNKKTLESYAEKGEF
jgi:hypothetical protein